MEKIQFREDLEGSLSIGQEKKGDEGIQKETRELKLINNRHNCLTVPTRKKVGNLTDRKG